METLDKYRSYLLLGLAIVALLLLAAFTDRNQSTSSQSNRADAADEAKVDTTVKTADTKTTTKSQPSYSYIAQPGDSYSKIARKAVQTYGIVNKVTLSQAQIVAAETILTQSAGSPELNEGQTVTLQAGQIKGTVDAAQKLSVGDQAQWQPYVGDVDFNTDTVGQNR